MKLFGIFKATVGFATLFLMAAVFKFEAKAHDGPDYQHFYPNYTNDYYGAFDYDEYVKHCFDKPRFHRFNHRQSADRSGKRFYYYYPAAHK